MDRGKGVGGGERSRGIAVGLMAADLVRGQRQAAMEAQALKHSGVKAGVDAAIEALKALRRAQGQAEAGGHGRSGAESLRRQGRRRCSD
jgi:hypothetical protein